MKLYALDLWEKDLCSAMLEFTDEGLWELTSTARSWLFNNQIDGDRALVTYLRDGVDIELENLSNDRLVRAYYVHTISDDVQ